MSQKITPCLWFDYQAEEAANFYLSVFKNSKITNVSRYSDVGTEAHGHRAGQVMTVAFELNGLKFTGLNGGPHFKFTEAISLQVECETQEEVDYYWEKLSEGGDPQAQQCGWVKDKFGLSWQIVPKVLIEMVEDSTSEKGQRAFKAMLGMKKLDIAALKKAYDGE